MARARPNNELAEVLRKCKRAFVDIGAFSAVINFLMLVPALYMLQVYDRVLQSRNETTLWMLTVIVLGLYAVLASLEYVRTQLAIRIGSKLDFELNRRVCTAAFEANLRHGGSVAGQALNDLTTVRQFVTGPTLFAFLDAPWFPIYVTVIFLFDVQLGLLALAGSLILITLAVINERISRKPLADANVLSLQSSNTAQTTLKNAEVIEAMGMLQPLLNRWYRIHSAFLAKQMEASRKASVIGSWTKLVRISLQSLVLGIGALLVLEDKITAGMMIAASILMGKALGPVEGVLSGWRNWSSFQSAYGRLSALLAANPERNVGLSLPKPEGVITVSHLVAAPPRVSPPVLRNISFKLPKGEVLGIIGPSACGKSTLARVLVGIWPALGGEVRLDGANVYQWNKDELGQAVGYLPQDVELFMGTVAENIARFGDLDSDKVVQAAQLAGVHDLILQLPSGYDTMLGEDGAGLSGGQKQRIGLARALYGSPSLIVLDEPNSNLDEAGEAALARAIAHCRQNGCTVVLITHRANVLATTTRLLVLRDGVMQAFGPTADVLRAMREPRGQPPGKAIEQNNPIKREA
ncbi:type I secretion system permease/ATPase [Allopusillimonas ginsengisoli]|nr:type I secretion system permease/ATPase [Allopusillimonas ginsengisoli]